MFSKDITDKDDVVYIDTNPYIIGQIYRLTVNDADFYNIPNTVRCTDLLTAQIKYETGLSILPKYKDYYFKFENSQERPYKTMMTILRR